MLLVSMPPNNRRLLISAAVILLAFFFAVAWLLFLHKPEIKPEQAPVKAQAESSQDWCGQLVKRLPTVPKEMCESIGLQPTGASSVKGFPILARDYAADGKRSEPLRILLIGGIHGDEPTAAAVVFRWMQSMHLPIAHSIQWRVAPVVNPDGLFATPQTRMNANGIDLNRNFDSANWERDAPKYWQQRTKNDPRRYPGKSPLSEPESRWVHDTIESFKPHVVISVHAPLGELDFDGPPHPPRRFGRLMYNRIGVYPGSLGNYGGGHKQIPVITIELDNAQKMPSDEEVKRIWRDMVIWISRNIPPPKSNLRKVQ
jgi:murein peptide amidase A